MEMMKVNSQLKLNKNRAGNQRRSPAHQVSSALLSWPMAINRQNNNGSKVRYFPLLDSASILCGELTGNSNFQQRAKILSNQEVGALPLVARPGKSIKSSRKFDSLCLKSSFLLRIAKSEQLPLSITVAL